MAGISSNPTSDFHEVTLQLVSFPNQHVVATTRGKHKIVRHQAMSTFNQIKHALRFADATLAGEKDSDAVYVRERAMQRRGWRKLVGEVRLNQAIELRSFEPRAQHGHAGMFGQCH